VGLAGERDDAVERGDEVRIQPRLRESERPARSGEVVRKSSSTSPARRREPNTVGPPSQRIRR
jgi:hypothetical protein